jgi:apolipoprotein N-acyltransferase
VKASPPPARRWGPGCAAVAVAALRLPPLRQAPTAEPEAGWGWGMIIVARGSSFFWSRLTISLGGES